MEGKLSGKYLKRRSSRGTWVFETLPWGPFSIVKSELKEEKEKKKREKEHHTLRDIVQSLLI